METEKLNSKNMFLESDKQIEVVEPKSGAEPKMSIGELQRQQKVKALKSFQELVIEQFSDSDLDYIVNTASMTIETAQWERHEETDEIIKAKTKTAVRGIVRVEHVVENVETGKQLYEVSWMTRQEQQKKVYVESAEVWRNTRKVIEMAEYGLPVTSRNTGDFVEYIDLYLYYMDIPKRSVISRLGRYENSFILPYATLTKEGDMVIHNDKLTFEANNVGDAKGFGVSGDLETWKTEVFNLVKHYPIALTFVLSSFASIMLEELGIDPFTIELAFKTSAGKSLLLALCNTVWGHPKELQKTWENTKNALEGLFALCNTLPVNLDDTRAVEAKNPKILVETVYTHSNREGKGRMNKNLELRDKKRWHNILQVTGELSIAQIAEKNKISAGGASARILSFRDAPFANADVKELGKKIRTAEFENYGVAGLQFAKHWIGLSDADKDIVADQVKQYRNHYERLAEGNDVLSRLANGMAVIHVAGMLANQWLSLGIDITLLDQAWVSMVGNNADVDKSKLAMEYLLNMCAKYTANFSLSKNLGKESDDIIPRPLYGLMEDDKTHIITNDAKDWLAKGGHDLHLADWITHGWITVKKGRKDREQTISYKNKVWVYTLNLDVINKALGVDEDDTETDTPLPSGFQSANDWLQELNPAQAIDGFTDEFKEKKKVVVADKESYDSLMQDKYNQPQITDEDINSLKEEELKEELKQTKIEISDELTKEIDRLAKEITLPTFEDIVGGYRG